MRINYYKYEDKNKEIISDGKTYFIIKDKNTHKYYKTPYSDKLFLSITWRKQWNNHSLILIILYWLLFVTLIVLNGRIMVYVQIEGLVSIKYFVIALLLYMIVFVIIHELGHLYMLRRAGKKANRVGFKFNYIFPSFFVQINESHMLDKVQKLYIHSGGLMNSLILNVAVYYVGLVFKISVMVAVSAYMSVTIVYNLLPIMNSDGFKILITCLNKVEKKEMKQNGIIINGIKAINIIFVLTYTLKFIFAL